MSNILASNNGTQFSADNSNGIKQAPLLILTHIWLYLLMEAKLQLLTIKTTSQDMSPSLKRLTQHYNDPVIHGT